MTDNELIQLVADEEALGQTLQAEMLEQAEAGPQPVAQPILYKFTNAAESPELDNLLAMFYQGVMYNTIGIMQAYNVEESREELILVGVEIDSDGKPDCYPLARVIKSEEAHNFLSPNGKGGFFNSLDAAEARDAKEEMRSFEEAVVE